MTEQAFYQFPLVNAQCHARECPLCLFPMLFRLLHVLQPEREPELLKLRGRILRPVSFVYDLCGCLANKACFVSKHGKQQGKTALEREGGQLLHGLLANAIARVLQLFFEVAK
jgi:hypothetical protein